MYGKKLRTPLFDAVYPVKGGTAVLEVLLNHAYDLHYRDYKGMTVVHHAVRTDAKECLAMLLARYPNVAIRSNAGTLAGFTAMEMAEVMLKRQRCKQLLEENERSVEALMRDVDKLNQHLANHLRAMKNNDGSVYGVGGAWCNHKGQSLISIAARLGQDMALRALLANAATNQMKEYADDAGWTRKKSLL